MAVPIAAIIQAASSIGSSVLSYWGSKSQNKLYDAQAAAYETNAEIAQKTGERQADYQTQEAASQVHALRKQGEEVKGSQLAAMAAQGMDISSGSAQDVLSASERAQREDEDLIRYNAELAALETRRGADAQAADLRHQANQTRIAKKQAKAAAKMALYGSILTGSSQVASSYFDGKK
uniref:Uncharacterized protein n=1 Tax=uncultured Elusimicrobia bacterium TaxID=699876 RepID=A0A650EM15_9BACT|nr:hypothetical protein Elusimicrob1349_1160 [uncultured Elusimicrobia bacterium]